MNSLQIFNSEEFGEIRTIEIDGKPYFVGADVAKALGYSNPRKAILDHCKGVTKRDTPTSSGVQSMSYINEGDLYRLIMKSKLPSAEKFESWVMDEVLPAIRKTGSYQKPMTVAEQIQLLAQGNVKLEEKIEAVNDDLQEFKRDMPLLALECQKITKAKNQKVVPMLGGKDAPAYKDNSLRQLVYSDIDAQLRREFGVNTYKAIKRNQCDVAIKIINEYELPMYLKDRIDTENAQESFL